jgi:hypothetical protein
LEWKAKILENATAFPSCGVYSKKLIQCPVGVWFRGDPAGAFRRGGSPKHPRTARSWSGNQQTSLKEPFFDRISGISIIHVRKKLEIGNNNWRGVDNLE